MKESIVKIFVITVSCMTIGCREKPITPMPPIVTDQAACPSACSNLRRMSCEEAQPIETNISCTLDFQCGQGAVCSGGACLVSCERFCVDTENRGVWLDPACVAKAMSCSDIDSCPSTK